MDENINSDWKPGDPIGYINNKIPEFELPAYEGERYEAMVPDTLDIAERARLAVHGLTEPTNPLADYEVYWIVFFRTNPPSMMQNCWQGHTVPKFMLAVSLMRIVSGSEQNLNIDLRWMEVALKSQGPDGLIYTPVRGRPWAYEWFPILDVKTSEDQLLSPFGNATMLSAMSHFAKRDNSSFWRDTLRRLVDGLIGLAIDTGEYAYFWPSCMIGTKEKPVNTKVPLRMFECEGSVVPHGLVHAYRVLGYEPALKLAHKYINYLRKNFYDTDGRFLASPGRLLECHFHAHSRGILAMEEYAEITHDQELMEFVVHSFEWARDIETNVKPGTSHYDVVKTPGAGLVGFFPEWVNSAAWQTSETCQITDMVALALRLSEAGLGDYWDDADRWIRNQLVENQLLSTDWIYRVSEEGNPVVAANNITTDRVPERNLGAFAGCPSANDWYAKASQFMHGIGHCCTANGSKVLYWIWERILRYQNGKLVVNLLLNRASAWADIDSYIPYQGRIDVKVKQPVELSIRIPEWVLPSETRCHVDNKERNISWDGRYAKIGAVKPGDVVVLTFPIFEQTDYVWIEKQQYKLIRKGNEVVSIDPPGRYCPLYQRQHYRDNELRWKKVEKFISDKQW